MCLMNWRIHQGPYIGAMVVGASMQWFESMRQHQWRLLLVLNGCASWSDASVLKGGYFGNLFEILITASTQNRVPIRKTCRTWVTFFLDNSSISIYIFPPNYTFFCQNCYIAYKQQSINFNQFYFNDNFNKLSIFIILSLLDLDSWGPSMHLSHNLMGHLVWIYLQILIAWYVTFDHMGFLVILDWAWSPNWGGSTFVICILIFGFGLKP